MGKNTEIKLVGQPILSQVLQLVDKIAFQGCDFMAETCSKLGFENYTF